MTFKELLKQLEQEIKKRSELLETAKDPLNFQDLYKQSTAEKLVENALAEARHRLALINEFLQDTKIDIDSDTGGFEQFLFLGRRV